MSLRDDVLIEVEDFLSSRKVEPTKFGREALGDPNFVRDLRNGRRIWPETAEKVRNFIAGRPANDERRGVAA